MTGFQLFVTQDLTEKDIDADSMGLCFVNQGLNTMRQVLADLNPSTRKGQSRGYHNIKSISWHSNLIPAIEPGVLNLFTNLKRLDLSSNKICKIQGLDSLTLLSELNLSNNEITVIEGLSALFNLQMLVLSYNRISSLEGIMELHGEQYSLDYLDIKGNLLSDSSQLHFLAGCLKLRHIILKSDLDLSRQNPLCKSKDPVYHSLRVFDLLPQLESVDLKNRKNQSVSVDAWQGADSFENLLALPREGRLHTEPRFMLNALPANSSDSRPQMAYSKQRPNENQQSASASLANIQQSVNPVDKERYEAHLTYLESIIDRLLQTAPLNIPEKLPEKDSNSQGHQNRTETDSLQKIETQLQSLEAIFREWGSTQQVAQKASTENARPESLRSNSPKHEVDDVKPSNSQQLKDGKRSMASKSKANQMHIIPTSQLIRALEEEEKRLKMVESDLLMIVSKQEQEIEKIKSEYTQTQTHLQEAKSVLLIESEKLKKADQENRMLQRTVLDQSQEIKKANAQLEEVEASKKSIQEELMKTTLKNEDFKANLDLISSKLQAQEGELVKLRKATCDAEIALANAEGKLNMFEDEKSRISVRFVKDREQYRVKIAEYRCENENLKLGLQRMQKEVEKLSETIAQKDNELMSQARGFNQSYSTELSKVISETTQKLNDQHSKEMGALKDVYERTKAAYKDLETEFKNAIKAERDEREKMSAKQQDLQTKYEAVAEQWSKTSNKEKELTSLVKELTVVVKEQKEKIEEMVDKDILNTKSFEEKLETLQDEKQVLLEKVQQMHSLKNHIEQLERIMDEKDKQLAQQHKQQGAEMDELHRQLVTERAQKTQILSDASKLESQVNDLKSQLETANQNLKVKTAMLDDQNDTIRSLKKNLENKVRETQNVQEKYQEQMSNDMKQVAELERELESQQAIVEHLRSLASDYKTERDDLKRKIIELSKKLKERNDSILQIEVEVGNVKKVFKSKEEKMKQMHQSQIDEKERAIREYQVMLESQSTKWSMWDREREGLMQTIKSLEKENQSLTREKISHDEEMKIVLKELDKQKDTMHRKMEKLRLVLD